MLFGGSPASLAFPDGRVNELWFVVVTVLQIGIVGGFIFGIHAWCRRRLSSDHLEALSVSLICLGAASYLQFWLACAHFGLAIAFKVVVFGGGTYLVYRALRSGGSAGGHHEMAVLLTQFLLIVAFTLFAAFSPGGLGDPLAHTSNVWSHQLPGDNLIPLEWADFLRAGSVPSPMHGDWLSSDRPPLQTGAYLLFGLPFQGIRALNSYEVCGAALQVAWVFGFDLLARTLGMAPRPYRLLQFAVALMPAILVQTIYVWPKLIAAGFMLAAIAVFLELREKRTWQLGMQLGALLALALLTHGGTVFAALPLGLLLLLSVRLIPPRSLVSVIAAATLLYLPWVAYQRFGDPPGNRLIKMHFAGVAEVDSRSALQAIHDAYGDLTWSQFLENKRLDLARITEGWRQSTADSIEVTSSPVSARSEGSRAWRAAQEARAIQFFGFIPSLGLMAIALFLLPWTLGAEWRQLSRRFKDVGRMVMAAFVFWILLLFPGGSTINHSGTYVLQIVVLMLTGWLVYRRSPALLTALVIGHGVLAAGVYVLPFVLTGSNGGLAYGSLLGLSVFSYLAFARESPATST